MLILGRKTGQKLVIGNNVVITIRRSAEGGVSVGIEAPRDVRVVRAELLSSDELAAITAAAKSGEESRAA